MSSWIKKGLDIDGLTVNERFGWSVKFSDNENIFIVGATKNNAGGNTRGCARVFEWVNNAWVQKGSTINGKTDNENCGVSVDINSSGNIIAIASDLNSETANSSGMVRLYYWNNTDWSQLGNDIFCSVTGAQSGNF